MTELNSANTWEAFKKQFPIGAKVQLVAGGPAMAVDKYVESPPFGRNASQIKCQWFSGKKLESGSFAPETLVLYKDVTKDK